MSDNIINTSVFNEMKNIMGNNFGIMIEYFISDGKEYISSINSGLETNDASKIKAPAHTIKSSSKQIGAEKLSEIAKQTESTASAIISGTENDFSKLRDLCQKLKEEFSKTEDEIKKIYSPSK